MLLIGTKPHHVFNAGAVVPTSVEDYDLACGGEVLYVPLHVHLALFSIRRSRQRHEAKDTRADALRKRTDGAPFAGGVTSFEDDDHPQTLVLDPFLEAAKFALKTCQFLLVLL